MFWVIRKRQWSRNHFRRRNHWQIMLTKVLMNWKIWKRLWSQSVGRMQIILMVRLKDIQDGLILIVSLRKIYTTEPDFYKTYMKRIFKVKKWNRINRFSYRLIKNLSRQKCNQCTKLDCSIKSTRTRSNSCGKIRTDISVNYLLTRETSSGLTVETGASVTPEKRIPKNK